MVRRVLAFLGRFLAVMLLGIMALVCAIVAITRSEPALIALLVCISSACVFIIRWITGFLDRPLPENEKNASFGAGGFLALAGTGLAVFYFIHIRVDIDMKVPAFSEADERVPDLDPAYVFDPDTTLAILAGFAHNRRVMVQGYHGTGKSTHIEQVAARLNWPCIRINLDSHISRIDLIGKDAIVLRDGKQVTEFREGMLPWALQHRRAGVRRIRRRPPGRDVRDPARAGNRRQADAARPEQGDPPASVRSACSPPPTPSASATPPASITARSRSTRARWTAGTSSSALNYLPARDEARSCSPRPGRHRGGRKTIANMVKVAD
jgi:cobaltochelatase CobS